HLPKQPAQFGLELWQGNAGPDPANHVEPIPIGLMDVGHVRQWWHGLNRQIEIWRGAGETIAVEMFRRDPDNHDRLRVYEKCAADDGRIGAIIMRPCSVTHYRGERRTLKIVGINEQTPPLRLKAEGPEVVARDELAHDRPRILLRSTATNDNRPIGET